MKNAKSFISLCLIVTLMIGILCVSNTVSAKDNTNVDFIFIIDSTGSMRDYIDNVNKNLTNFVTGLSNRGIDLRMAVVDYKDVTVFDDGPNQTTIHQFDGKNWTNDVEQVINAFNSIHVEGGGDDNETPTEAINQALNNLKTEDEWYNDGHKTFMFLLTDADYKESSDSSSNPDLVPDMSAAVYVNRMLGINTTVVSKTNLEEKYKQLYSLTGGIFIDINSDNYDELMNEVAVWIEDSIVDSDGDGLPDEWETNGVTIDGTFIDFPRMGANPRKPDIFIEADWMEYAGDQIDFLWIHEIKNKKNTAPSASSLRKVYDQFNSHGIKIHIDAGPNSIMNYDTNETWGELSRASALAYQETFYLGNNYKNWNQLAIDNFTKARWSTFRYCVFVNQYDAGNGNRSSGIAENIPGQFFIIASGCIDGSKSNRYTALAGTIMHELGHTLGLSHGGLYYDSATNDIVNDHNHYKWNHLSIMNYTYQFSGLKTVLGDYVCNYQDFDLPEIDENHVDELQGIDPQGVTDGKGLTIRIPVKNKFLFLTFDGTEDSDIARQPIDFNKNGTFENDIVCHLDKEPDQTTEVIGTLHETLNEWSNIHYTGGLISGKGEEIDLSKVTTLITKSELSNELDEMTADAAFELGLLGDIGECEFDNFDSKVLYSELEGQTITVKIINKYPEKTKVNLKISSDVLPSDYVKVIDVDTDGAEIEIPVKNDLKVGDYNVQYSMELSNGKTVNQTIKTKVIAPERIDMILGEKTTIPNQFINNCVSSNADIVDVVNNEIVAKSVGSAYLKIESEDTYYAKVKVTDSNNKPDNDSSNESNNEPSIETSKGSSDYHSNEPSYEHSDESSQKTSDSPVINPNNNSPATGDSSPLGLMFVCLTASLFMLIFCVKHRKRKTK